MHAQFQQECLVLTWTMIQNVPYFLFHWFTLSTSASVEVSFKVEAEETIKKELSVLTTGLKNCVNALFFY